jgi:16S rRNA (guanine966-N2)-methyltransferase
MLRISSGIVKNKKLKAPKTENFRAVQEVAKQAVFSIIGDKIIDAKCLDLFAGSGNLGLEALSRGAAHCTFIDENYDAIGCIRENVKKCGFEEKAEIERADAVKFAANTKEKFDIIFVDPFYENTSHIFLMKNLEEILNKEGLIVFFHGDNLDINKVMKDTSLKIITERRFGKSFFTIFSTH